MIHRNHLPDKYMKFTGLGLLNDTSRRFFNFPRFFPTFALKLPQVSQTKLDRNWYL
jgi:hypothetical protein